MGETTGLDSVSIKDNRACLGRSKVSSYRAARWCWWCVSCWETPWRDAGPCRCTVLRPSGAPSSASASRKAVSSHRPERERRRRSREWDKQEAESRTKCFIGRILCSPGRIYKLLQIKNCAELRAHEGRRIDEASGRKREKRRGCRTWREWNREGGGKGAESVISVDLCMSERGRRDAERAK